MRNAITGSFIGWRHVCFACHVGLCAGGGQSGRSSYATPYTNEVRANTYGYTPGSGGPLGVFAAPFTAAPLAVMNGAPGAGGCGVSQDFNGRLTALCGL